jgi:SagB-type dehydrogenase family enzyme
MEMRKQFLVCLAVLALCLGAVAQSSVQATAPAAAGSVIELPAPSLSGGMSLTQALAARRSVRAYLPTPLTKAELSQILWAAQGVTDKQGRRTAPSAAAQNNVHLYVASAEGFFEYLPSGHKLQKLSDQDLRSKLSAQQSVNQAPTVLLIAGENERAVAKYGQEKGIRFVILEAGHVAQNVLLQATALGLGTVPVGGIEPKDVQKAASLPAQYNAIYLIPVGHPK